MEALLVRPSGGALHVLVSAAPVVAAGSPVGAVLVCEDMSRQVEVRERLQTIFASVPQGVVLIDDTATILAANTRATEIAGRALAGLSVRDLAAVFVRPDGTPVAEHERPHARALAGETVPSVDLVVQRADGERLPISVSATPVAGPEGRAIGAVVVFEDATRVRESLLQREAWIARVAHDLRQPLAVIQTYLDRLRRMREAPSAVETERILGRTLAAAGKLDRMIDELLDVARIESGELCVERRPTDLAALAREVADRTAAVEGRSIEVEVRGFDRVLDIDAGRVEQLLGNLLSNAIKYGAPEAPIALTVDIGEDRAELAVTNEGLTIPEDERAQLFSRFFRGKGATRARGTGLGLYICKAIAEAHGGDIGVECPEGGPTTFRVRLPAR
jgi:PAS domain S-box-containing protein